MLKRLILAILPLTLLACEGKKPEPGPETKELTAPQGLKMVNATENTLEFSWTAVPGAESYIWRLTLNATVVTNGITPNTALSIDGLKEGTTYSFTVRAAAGESSSAWSKPLEASTLAPEPEKPTGKTQCVDAPLVLEMSGTPRLGNSGSISIFKKDGTRVDRIDLADLAKVKVRDDGAMVPAATVGNDAPFHTFMDALPCSGKWRAVHYTPLRTEAGKLIVRPHTGVLEFDTEYYVTVDAGVVEGFPGIDAGEWTFATSSAPASAASLRVAADGSGDFCTVQRALDYADKGGAVISIAPGTYSEMLFAREKSGITLKGDSREGVRIVYPNNESYETGSGGSISSRPSAGASIGKSGGRGVFLVENCDNLVIQDLTLENSFGELKGQAEAIYFNSGSNQHRLTVENCSLLSYQDTFLCKGVVWVHNSLIAGHCDFVWGYPKACLFEDCEIRSRAAGYIVQARVPSASDKGFVFLNCRLTAENGVKDGSMYLARSAGQADCFDNVVYVGCTMGPVINAGGWLENPKPNPASPTATSGWREYGSVTPSGSSASAGRNGSGLVLSAAEAEAYSSRQAVLGW